jgi:hypothetical protein
MWYYILDDKQAGPVKEEEIQVLIQEGTLKSTTKVWRQGMLNWQPLAVTGLSIFLPAGSVPLSIVPEPVYALQPQRPVVKRSGLKTLYIWWVVMYCFTLISTLPSFGLNLVKDQSAKSILTALICILEIPMLAGSILMFVLLYKLWSVVQDGQAATTPGKAVGFLFIPFFNFYWIFQAFWGLAKDLNRYIKQHFGGNADEHPRQTKPWISLAYIIYAYVFGLIYFVLSMVNIAATFSSLQTTSAITSPMALPFTIFGFTFSLIAFIWILIMFTDYYRTADSILKAERKE